MLKSFEKWRKELELEDFHLCAHSMGVSLLLYLDLFLAFSMLTYTASLLFLQAIFASSYAIQHPKNVKVSASILRLCYAGGSHVLGVS